MGQHVHPNKYWLLSLVEEEESESVSLRARLRRFEAALLRLCGPGVQWNSFPRTVRFRFAFPEIQLWKLGIYNEIIFYFARAVPLQPETAHVLDLKSLEREPSAGKWMHVATTANNSVQLLCVSCCVITDSMHPCECHSCGFIVAEYIYGVLSLRHILTSALSLAPPCLWRGQAKNLEPELVASLEIPQRPFKSQHYQSCEIARRLHDRNQFSSLSLQIINNHIPTIFNISSRWPELFSPGQFFAVRCPVNSLSWQR